MWPPNKRLFKLQMEAICIGIHIQFQLWITFASTATIFSGQNASKFYYNSKTFIRVKFHSKYYGKFGIYFYLCAFKCTRLIKISFENWFKLWKQLSSGIHVLALVNSDVDFPNIDLVLGSLAPTANLKMSIMILPIVRTFNTLIFAANNFKMCGMGEHSSSCWFYLMLGVILWIAG